MYYIVFIFIALAFLTEIKRGKTNSKIFNILYILLTALASFRFGQGTDYFNYLTIYNASIDLNSWAFQKDPGFAYLCHLFAKNQIPYPYFSGFVALLTMILAYPFFSKICKYSIFPLFIFYTYIFLIYPMSGIRQGLAISIVLGILYPLMINRKYIYFYMILLLGSLFHLSIIVCALLPFVYNLNLPIRTLIIIVGLSTAILFLNLNLIKFLPITIDRAEGYIDNYSSSFNLLPRFLRLLIIIMILSVPDVLLDLETKKIRMILVFGYFAYSVLSFSDMLAGRIETYFRIFEMVFIFMLAYKSIRLINYKKYVYFFFLLYTPLWFKNVQSQLDQGEYNSKFILSYPYISIFNPQEITKYRNVYYYNSDYYF